MATRLLLLWLGKEMFHPWQFGARSNQFFVPKVLKNTTSNSAGDLFSEGYISDLQLTTSRAIKKGPEWNHLVNDICTFLKAQKHICYDWRKRYQCEVQENLKDLHRSHMVGPAVGRCTAATRFLAIYHGVSQSVRRRTVVSRWVARKMKDPSRWKNWYLYLRFTVRPCICLPTVCHLGKT